MDSLSPKKPRCNAEFDEVPEWARDNEYVQSGYRVDYEGQPQQVCQTMCKCHNETVNVWTHMIGALTFFSLCIIIITFYQSYSSVG